jgi:hypothetical protein
MTAAGGLSRRLGVGACSFVAAVALFLKNRQHSWYWSVLGVSTMSPRSAIGSNRRTWAGLQLRNRHLWNTRTHCCCGSAAALGGAYSMCGGADW